jgi:hypothetical protein
MPEVELDRARAKEELRGRLLVRSASRDNARDLQLLRGQLVDRARVTFARGLAASTKLGAGTLGPGRCPQLFEELERDPEMFARLLRVTTTPEHLAIDQLGPGSLEGSLTVGVKPKRLPKVIPSRRVG